MDYNTIALQEYGMTFNQLGKQEQEWVRDEAQENY